MSYQYTKKPHSFLREIYCDLPFFLPPHSKRFIRERTILWERQVNMLARIEHGDRSILPDWKLTRVGALIDNLNTLDRKFSTLLQFQALLGIATSIFIATLKDIVLESHGIIFLLGIFSITWFTITFICMRGVGRIRWGDLWMPMDADTAERQYVRALIHAVVGRTALFRLAVLLTFLNGIVLLFIILGTGISAL